MTALPPVSTISIADQQQPPNRASRKRARSSSADSTDRLKRARLSPVPAPNVDPFPALQVFAELVDDLLLLVAKGFSRADRVVFGHVYPRAAALMLATESPVPASSSSSTDDHDASILCGYSLSPEAQVCATYGEGSLEQIIAIHERLVRPAGASFGMVRAQWIGLLGSAADAANTLGNMLLDANLIECIASSDYSRYPVFIGDVLRHATVEAFFWCSSLYGDTTTWLVHSSAQKALLHRGNDASFVNAVLDTCWISCFVAQTLFIAALKRAQWPLARGILEFRSESNRGHYRCIIKSDVLMRSKAIRILIAHNSEAAMEFLLSPSGCGIQLNSALLYHLERAAETSPRALAYVRQRLAGEQQ